MPRRPRVVLPHVPLHLIQRRKIGDRPRFLDTCIGRHQPCSSHEGQDFFLCQIGFYRLCGKRKQLFL